MIFCLSCGRANKPEIKTQNNSNLFSTNESIYIDQVLEAKKSAGEIPYSKIQFDHLEYDKKEKWFHHWGEYYHCFSKEMDAKGSVVIIKGNTESVEEEFKSKDFDFMKENFSNIKNFALATDREFCVYDLRIENLDNISQKANTEFLISIGHGVNGVLESQKDEELGVFSIYPYMFSEFQSPNIVMVDFINCQAGNDEESWKELFPDHSLFHIKDTDISAQKSLEYLNSEYLKAMLSASESIKCSELNKYNQAIVKTLNSNNKCSED